MGLRVFFFQSRFLGRDRSFVFPDLPDDESDDSVESDDSDGEFIDPESLEDELELLESPLST